MAENYTNLSTWQYRPELSNSRPYIDIETGIQTDLSGYEAVVNQRSEELKSQIDAFSVSDRLVHEGGVTLAVAAKQAFIRDVSQNYSREQIALSEAKAETSSYFNFGGPQAEAIGTISTEEATVKGLAKSIGKNPGALTDAITSVGGRTNIPTGLTDLGLSLSANIRDNLKERAYDYHLAANAQAHQYGASPADYFNDMMSNSDMAGQTAISRVFGENQKPSLNDYSTLQNRLDVDPVNASKLTHLGKMHFFNMTPRISALRPGVYSLGGTRRLTVAENTYYLQSTGKTLYSPEEIDAGEKTYNMVRDQTEETSLAHADFQSAQNVSSMSVPSTPPEKAFQTAVRMSGMLADDLLSMNGFKSIKDFNTHLETSRNVLVHEYGRTAVQAMGKLTKEGIVFDENRVKEVAKNRAFADPNKTRGKHAPVVAEQIAGEVEMAKSMNMSHTEYVGWSRKMDALISEVTDYTAPPPEDDPMMSPDFDWEAFARNVENASAQQTPQPEESFYSPAHAQTLSKAALEQALDGLTVDPSMQSAPVEQDFVTAPSTPQRPPAELAKQARTNVQDMTYGEVMSAMNSPDYTEFAHPNGQSTFNAIRDWNGWKQDNPKDYSPPASQATAPQRSTPQTPAATDYAAIDAMGDITGMMSKPDGTSVRAAQQSYADIVAKERKDREEAAKAQAKAAEEAKRQEQERMDRWKAAEKNKQQRVAEANQQTEEAIQTEQTQDAKAALNRQKKALREESALLGAAPPKQETTFGNPTFEKTAIAEIKEQLAAAQPTLSGTINEDLAKSIMSDVSVKGFVARQIRETPRNMLTDKPEKGLWTRAKDRAVAIRNAKAEIFGSMAQGGKFNGVQVTSGFASYVETELAAAGPVQGKKNVESYLARERSQQQRQRDIAASQAAKDKNGHSGGGGGYRQGNDSDQTARDRAASYGSAP